MIGLVAVRKSGLLFLYHPTLSSSFYPVQLVDHLILICVLLEPRNLPSHSLAPAPAFFSSYLGTGQVKKGKRWITTDLSLARHGSDTLRLPNYFRCAWNVKT